MFRLCLDLATQPLLPEPDTTSPQPNAKQRRDLGLRVSWLLDNGMPPEALRELATCIREDGNDGAHAGTLTAVEAHDLLDFTVNVLERLFTDPTNIEIAKQRRIERRKGDRE
jgi:Domain of unknown function (DUF4145)